MRRSSDFSNTNPIRFLPSTIFLNRTQKTPRAPFLMDLVNLSFFPRFPVLRCRSGFFVFQKHGKTNSHLVGQFVQPFAQPVEFFLVLGHRFTLMVASTGSP